MVSREVFALGGGKPGGVVSAETRGESCELFLTCTVPRRTEHELDLRKDPGLPPRQRKRLGSITLDAVPKASRDTSTVAGQDQAPGVACLETVSKGTEAGRTGTGSPFAGLLWLAGTEETDEALRKQLDIE